jgi:hypothetical protein
LKRVGARKKNKRVCYQGFLFLRAKAEGFARNFPVIEVKDFAPDDLIILVAFTSYEHKVSRARLLYGAVYSGAAVCNFLIRFSGKT